MIEIEVRQQAKGKAERLKHTMSNLTEDKFSPNAYWKLKQAADKKLAEETVYSVKKENGVEITGEKGIMDAYTEKSSNIDCVRGNRPKNGKNTSKRPTKLYVSG